MKGDEVLEKLAEAWNAYLKEFPDIADKATDVNDRINFKAIANRIDERIDFKNTIHNAQRIIMAKQLKEFRPDKFNT